MNSVGKNPDRGEGGVAKPPEKDMTPLNSGPIQEGVAKDRKTEAVQREADEENVGQIRDQLGLNTGTGSKEQGKKTPEELYSDFFAGKLEGVIKAWGLGSDIAQCKKILEKSKGKNRVRYEKKAVRYLIDQFKKIKFKKWAFFPEAMAREKATNCSGAAVIFSHIMNHDLHIKTEQVNPMGHAATMVTYSDGANQYVDPRNQIMLGLDLGQPVEVRDGFRIYKVNKRGFEFTLLPVAKTEHAATLVLMENALEMHKERETDSEAGKTLNAYGPVVDQDFAEMVMKNNFLTSRENEPQWIEEKERIKRVRSSIFGRFI